MTLSKRQRAELRLKYGGKCSYCGVDLETRWHADHKEPVVRKMKFATDDKGMTRMVPTGECWAPENDCFDNLMPACAPCNIDKATMPLESWRVYLGERISDGLERNSSTFRAGLRFGRITVIKGPIVFWFERYEKDESMETPYELTARSTV